MKKLLLITLMSAYAMSGFTNEAELQAIQTANENARLCKIFKGKVELYKSSMREDDLAKATLVSYEQRMATYCNIPSEKAKEVKVETVKPVKVAKATIKVPQNTEESARLCNVFTDKVKTYESSMRNDSLAEATLVSYKDRMSAYCAATPNKL